MLNSAITRTVILAALLLLAAGCSASAPPQAGKPAQVDPTLMGQLRTELTRVLASRGITLDADGNPVGKAVSSVPKREYRFPDRFNDLFNDQASLFWVHYMQGDYDYNGEVNVSDLTPIGVYYGATSSDTNWAEARRADGDGNGEVNIADVTPIGQNFGAQLAGYAIQWRFNANDEWSDYGFAPFYSAPVQQANGEMGYSAPAATEADSFRITPVAGAHEFAWTNYQLDDNQSSYEYAQLAVHDEVPTIAFVDDGSGRLLYGSARVLHPTSAADWDIGVVDSSDVMPQQPQLKYFAGVPAIVYVGRDPTLLFELRFARVMQLTPPTTSAQIHTIRGQLPDSPPAFIYKDGLPVVGYSDGSTYSLYVTSFGAPSSSSDWDQIDTGQNVTYATLALAGNLVCLAAYQPGSPAELLFSHSLINHPTGPADFDSYGIDFIGGVAETPSMFAVGGLPCVADNNTGATSVDYLRPTVFNPSLPAMWTPLQFYSDPFETSNPELTLVDGRPAVCFGRTTLNFAWSVFEQPLLNVDWVVTTGVDGEVNYNSYPPSMIEIDGLPIVSYIQYNPSDSTRHVYLAVASEQ